MKLIEWDQEKFSVGIKKMDDEHKKLVELINALHTLQDADLAFVKKIINTLVLYTQIHFSHEEKILLKMHYPNFEAHHQEHLKFIGMVKKANDQLQVGVDEKKVLSQITDFLKNWLMHHILVEDRLYYDYLTS